jgi:rod shape-determining protein MreB and related proteins
VERRAVAGRAVRVVQSSQVETLAFIGVSALPTYRPLVALDMGSYRTRMARIGKPGSLDELSLVGLSSSEPGQGQRVMALSSEALAAKAAMKERLELVWPVNGAVGDYVTAEAMLRYYTRKLLPSLQFLKPGVVASLPTGASEAEKRTSYDTILAGTGAHAVYLVSEALAAGAAAGKVKSLKPVAIMVLGAGGTSIGIMVDGGLVHERRYPLGGNHLDQLIRRRIREDFGRWVDLSTCRELKHLAGSVGRADAVDSQMPGNLFDESGLAVDAEEVAATVRAALETGVDRLVEEIGWYFQELRADFERALDSTPILLAGDSAKLAGLPDRLAEGIRRDTHVLDQPEYAVMKGMEAIAAKIRTKGPPKIAGRKGRDPGQKDWW